MVTGSLQVSRTCSVHATTRNRFPALPLCARYYGECHALVFCVDSADRGRLEEAKAALDRALGELAWVCCSCRPGCCGVCRSNVASPSCAGSLLLQPPSATRHHPVNLQGTGTCTARRCWCCATNTTAKGQQHPRVRCSLVFHPICSCMLATQHHLDAAPTLGRPLPVSASAAAAVAEVAEALGIGKLADAGRATSVQAITAKTGEGVKPAVQVRWHIIRLCG